MGGAGAGRLVATLHEIFSGIQGEGVLVGVRQLFVRFHGCQLACAYCDTPASRRAFPAVCLVENAPGAREFTALSNPLDVADVLDLIRALSGGYPHHSVAVTGGEPLLHGDALNALLPALHREGIATYLETNGALADALRRLDEPPTHLAMDIKLPGATGGPALWDDHAAFLDAALERMDLRPPGALQVKLVFAAGCLGEIARAAALIADRRRDLPTVLQPVTPRPGGPPAPPPGETLEAQRLAAAALCDVRVIPQTHVMLGQR
ncbi:MAG TPA: 7-carboxy-7-deazaguanine synthase QueE [Armatimonadota bacterium]|nr:7-carboxy-7-deazaguanine synthase QueE [Armatimonadota bacterium]